MGKKKAASPVTCPDPVPGFEIQWETKVKHEIGHRGARFWGPSLILNERYDGGITCFDPVSRVEKWHLRLRDSGFRVELRVVGEAGDQLLVSSRMGFHLVNRESGEARLVESLEVARYVSFSHFTGSHAIFTTLDEGLVVMDMASGKVEQYTGAAHELEPCTGFGESFFAREPDTESVARYIGRYEAGTGRLLKSNSRLLDLPEAEPKILNQGCAGSVLVIPGDRGCRIWIYSWSGEVLRELAIKEPSIDRWGSLQARLLVGPDGSLDRLLAIVCSTKGSQVFLFDLNGQGQLIMSKEVLGNRNDELVIAGNRLFWIEIDYYDIAGGNWGKFFDFVTGESGTFLGEPVESYLATDGRGIFFGKARQGDKHLAYGIFASS